MANPQFSSGDTAWLLASSALVLLMTPGLAFFYGGMVRVKSVLNMIMMSFATIGVVSILWVLFGYSLAFKGTNPFIGDLSAVGLHGLLKTDSGTIPELVFSAFQLMFAIITPALISGAIADRVKFGAWVLFVAVWTTIVYFPVAHWVFYFNGGKGGWIGDRMGAFDFAGGTAVHINAGAAGLALALVLGKRVGWRRDPMRPHNLPLVLLGAGMLWFGWFGFNAGSALAANDVAVNALVDTNLAAAAAGISWMLVDWIRKGRPSAVGMAVGAVCGLAAVTPASGYVSPGDSILIGLVAGILSNYVANWRARTRLDDSLDVFACHGAGGMWGTVATGLFASTAINAAGPNGLVYGNPHLLLVQLFGVGVVAGFSFVGSYLLLRVINHFTPLRVAPAEESAGLDISEFGEAAYDPSGGSEPDPLHGPVAPTGETSA